MHDKKMSEIKKTRLERLSEIALDSYIKAHCGALVHESEETVGKVLTNFAKAIHAAENNELPDLARAFELAKAKGSLYGSQDV